MSQELNPRQLRFIDGYLSGKSAKQAYIDAGYEARGSAAESGAGQLLRNTKVMAAIDTARDKAMESQAITVDWVLEHLKTEATLGGEGGSPSARVRALELIGKHLKMFTEKVEHGSDPDNPVKHDHSGHVDHRHDFPDRSAVLDFVRDLGLPCPGDVPSNGGE